MKKNLTIMTLTCPFMAAMCMGVYPVGVSTSRSTPLVVSHLTVLIWPVDVARWRAVQPFSSFELNSYRLMFYYCDFIYIETNEVKNECYITRQDSTIYKLSIKLFFSSIRQYKSNLLKQISKLLILIAMAAFVFTCFYIYWLFLGFSYLF